MSDKTEKRRKPLSRKARNRITALIVTSFTLAILFLFLLPLVYGIVTALKTDAQFSQVGAPWWPATEKQFEYEGKSYAVYRVPMEDGEIRDMALVVPGRQESQFVDIDNPDAGLITWQGSWRALDRDWEFDPQWDNFTRAWNTINFPRLLWNTVKYAGITTFGAVFSS
ncbi:MAG: hypothetical protein K0B06_12270, partial [Brevefilum sp.]|nr:hypothetical protein [Brevefilum sp.]